MTVHSFLRADPGRRTFTPEDLSDDARSVGTLIDEFWARDVAPALPALLRREPGVGRSLLLKASALGLTALHIPDEYGGANLDLASIMVAAEHLAEDPSYSGWHMGHAGIGTLPLVWFGNDAQKRRYLPRMSSADLMAAYALTEADAGTDALSLRTRADLSDDGRSYVLRGQKMWITSGGVADVFVVFAKVGGTALTAFIVERDFGLVSGSEEHKMGLSGTSTTALYLDDVRVPVENVLGEIGRGHHIAFRVLNAGRLLMGPLAIRGAKRILQESAAYARKRHTFGLPIAEHGAVREMLVDASVALFAAESATWRAAGLVQAAQATRVEIGRPEPTALAEAFEQCAAECSIVKVAASEMLGRVADYGVQIHGGYGYHADYFVERAYRDARVNRIFEGTNEINRVLIPGAVLKQDGGGAGSVMNLAALAFEGLGDEKSMAPAATTAEVVERLRELTLAMLGAGLARHGDELRRHQSVTIRIADAMIETFVAEAAALRARRLGECGASAAEAADAKAALNAHRALARVGPLAEAVAMATVEADTRGKAIDGIRRLGRAEPVDEIGLIETIARSEF